MFSSNQATKFWLFLGFLCLSTFLFFSCKKDHFTPDTTNQAGSVQYLVSDSDFNAAISGLSTEAEKNFFNLQYASKNNPFVSEKSDQRNEDDPLVKAMCFKLLNINKQNNFLPNFIQQLGYPHWDHSITFQKSEQNSHSGVILPIAKLNVDSCSSFLIGVPLDNNAWYFEMVTRDFTDSIIQLDYPVNNQRFYLAASWNFDYFIFDKKNMQYAYWLKNNNFAEINDRDPDITVVCPPLFDPQNMVFTDNSVTDRQCYSYYSGGSAENTPGVYTGGSAGQYIGGVGGIFGGGGGISGEFQQILQGLDILDPDNIEGGTPTQNQVRLYNLVNYSSLSVEVIEAVYYAGMLNQVYAYLSLNMPEGQFDPIAEMNVTLIGRALRESLITEQQAKDLLTLITTLGLSSDQVAWLCENGNVITELDGFIDSHSATASEKNTAHAVSLAYLSLKMNPDANVQQMLNDISSQSIGNPLLEILGEQIADLVADVLIDIIPGGTLITMGPQALQQFQDGDILGGLWTVVQVALDEGSAFIPVAKIGNVAINLANNAVKLSRFYDVMKKAYTLGDDVAYRVYQVLRNKIDDIYSKVSWTGNGAKVEGVGDPLDFFDELTSLFPGGTLSGGNGNELVYTFSNITIKFYPSSTSSGEPTISIKKGSYEFKLRF